jgi:hypothetical protein
LRKEIPPLSFGAEMQFMQVSCDDDANRVCCYARYFELLLMQYWILLLIRLSYPEWEACLCYSVSSQRSVSATEICARIQTTSETECYNIWNV